MLKKVPEGMIVTDHKFKKFEDEGDSVKLFFENGNTADTDLMIGADGIYSAVREQLWNTPKPKKLGIAVWLGWCEVDGTASKKIIIQHNRNYQFGFAPLLFEGKKCYEWWFVEEYKGQKKPKDVMNYIKTRVKDFAEPTLTILKNTDPEHQLFRWEVEYIPCMDKWAKGRVTIMGDAAHPTSPYAAYGAGMAIEDGYFLGKYLKGKNLSNINELQEGVDKYEDLRRPYTNFTTKFARNLGRMYHNIPGPLKYFRDLFLDNFSLPGKNIAKGITEEATSLLAEILDE